MPRPRLPATASRSPRTLIADVTLLPEPDRAKARIGIRWHAGTADQADHRQAPPERDPRRHAVPGRRADPPPRACQRATTTSLPSSPGTATPTKPCRPFDVKAEQRVRRVYDIPEPRPLSPLGRSASRTPPARLGCSPGVVYYWIETGQIEARPGSGSLALYPRTPDTEAGCRDRIAAPGTSTPPPAAPGHGKRPAAPLSSLECHHLLALSSQERSTTTSA